MDFSLVLANGDYSLVLVHMLLIAVISPVVVVGMQALAVVAHGLSRCSSQALEHRLSSCGTQALVAPQHVGSSRLRDRTCHLHWQAEFFFFFFTTEPPGKPVVREF